MNGLVTRNALVGGLLFVAAITVCFVLYETYSEHSKQSHQARELQQSLLSQMARLESKLDNLAAMQPASRSDSRFDENVTRPSEDIVATTQPKRAESTQGRAQLPLIADQLREGRSIVDRAIAAGNWTQDDDSALTSATPNLSADEVFELHRQVAVAVNDGRLTLSIRH